MEELKKTLLETGKNTLNAALSLVRTTAGATADLLGRAAGHAVKFAKEQGGELVKATGGKVKTAAQDHRQGLLLIAAAVSGVVMIASLVGYLLGRKK
ncbi:MAG: hypothetical protein IJL08_08655 [Oscillospiraceae bacterium]|nr:hypothetical protein [Oscillospiraceae bacterium]